MMQLEKLTLILAPPIFLTLGYFVAIYEPSRDIIATARSPLPLIATIEDSSMGATTPFVYRVYVRATADEEGQLTFLADDPEGLSIKWIQPNHLLICFERADRHYARSFFFLQSGHDWLGGPISYSKNLQDCKA